jgi:glycerol-3-phosphate dehydrogenase (NAD(P)+)
MSGRTIGILGGGRWGMALATAAKVAGNPVLVCSRREPEVRAEGIELTADSGQLGARCTLVIFAVPSDAARAAAASLGGAVDGSHLVVHAVRGLSDEGLLPVSEIVRQETPVRRVGALAGPVLADELLHGEPAAMVTASRYPEVVDAVQQALGSPTLRVSQSSDLVGLEWASALVGALMVGIGFARALGVSPGLLAGLMTRGMHEAAKIGVAAGGEEGTFFGLGGFGDLMAAMSQEERPEVRFGRMLASGASATESLKQLGMRIEAVDLVPRVLGFAKERGLGVPVFGALAAALEGRAEKEKVLSELMSYGKR